jgi:type VII secretion-associated serine protease mycosin
MLGIVITLVIGRAAPASADAIREREWITSSLSLTHSHQISEGAGIVIALIDTGVDANHIDLRGNVLPGFDFTSGTTRGVGLIDSDGHGTAMAGLIVGHGHGANGQDGIEGIAPKAQVISLRTSATSIGSGALDALALTWAVNHGAAVVCMPSAGPIESSQVATAIQHALNANVVVVAAAGNTTEGARTVQYPAAYPGVLAVGGTDEHGNHSAVSVTGKSISIAAPSDNVPSTYKDGGYAVGSGTSSSTAIVAGAAALVRSRFPNLTASQVIDRLTETAIDKGPPGRDDEYGYGLLNIVGALTAKLPVRTPSLSPTEVGSSPQAVPPTTTSGARPASRSATTAIVVISALVVLVVATAAWLYARRRARPRGP